MCGKTNASTEYQTILGSCTEGGVRLLKALAKAGGVREINGGEFISRYGLKAASGVIAALKSLREADLVAQTEKGTAVYDRFFGLWLAQLS